MLARFCKASFLALFWLLLLTTATAADGTTPPLRTPGAGPQPHINGPVIYGVRPG